MPPGTRDITLVIRASYVGQEAFQAAQTNLSQLRAAQGDFSKYAASLEKKAASGEFHGIVQTQYQQMAERAKKVAESQMYGANALAQMERQNRKGGVFAGTLNEEDSRKLHDQQAKIKADAEAGWNASQAKVKGDLSAYQLRTQMEDRFYAMTHSARQVELRRINEFYAQQRTAAKGNAGALVAVNKAYDAEIAQFNSGPGGGNVSMRSVFGRHGIGRYGAQMLGASALGGVSPELGMLATMLPMEGLGAGAMAAAGGAAASLGLLALSIKLVGDAAEKHATRMKELSEQGDQIVRMGAEMAEERHPLSAAQKEFQKRQKEMSDQKFAIRDAAFERNNPGFFSSLGKWAVGNIPLPSDTYGGPARSMKDVQAEQERSEAAGEAQNLKHLDALDRISRADLAAAETAEKAAKELKEHQARVKKEQEDDFEAAKKIVDAREKEAKEVEERWTKTERYRLEVLRNRELAEAATPRERQAVQDRHDLEELDARMSELQAGPWQTKKARADMIAGQKALRGREDQNGLRDLADQAAASILRAGGDTPENRMAELKLRQSREARDAQEKFGINNKPAMDVMRAKFQAEQMDLMRSMAPRGGTAAMEAGFLTRDASSYDPMKQMGEGIKNLADMSSQAVELLKTIAAKIGVPLTADF